MSLTLNPHSDLHKSCAVDGLSLAGSVRVRSHLEAHQKYSSSSGRAFTLRPAGKKCGNATFEFADEHASLFGLDVAQTASQVLPKITQLHTNKSDSIEVICLRYNERAFREFEIVDKEMVAVCKAELRKMRIAGAGNRDIPNAALILGRKQNDGNYSIKISKFRENAEKRFSVELREIKNGSVRCQLRKSRDRRRSYHGNLVILPSKKV